MTTRFLGKAASSSRQAVSEPGEVPRPSDGTAPILRTALRKKTGHPKLTVGEGPSWTSGAGGCDKLAVIRSPHQLPQHQAQRRLRPPDTPGTPPPDVPPLLSLQVLPCSVAAQALLCPCLRSLCQPRWELETASLQPLLVRHGARLPPARALRSSLTVVMLRSSRTGMETRSWGPLQPVVNTQGWASVGSFWEIISRFNF